jgi:hypothetical protein
MKIVSNWKESYKWVSVHCMAIAGALSALSTYVITEWNSFPPEWQQIILHYYPEAVVFKIISVLSIFGIIGRFINQSKDYK